MQAIGVLIFVDQNMVEPAADVVRQRRLGGGLRPIEQKVVVIENVLRLLGLDVSREQIAQLRPPSGAPGKGVSQHLVERQFGVDGAGINGEAGSLGREPARRLGEAKFMAGEVHQIGGIFPVVDREIRIEPDLLGVVAQDSRANPMEGAGPCERVGHQPGVRSHRLRADALDAARHLGRRPTGEGHQQDTAGVGAVDDQMRDAMGERVRLAGPGPGDDEKRSRGRALLLPRAMFDGPSLLGIEFLQIGQRRRLRIGGWGRADHSTTFLVLFTSASFQKAQPETCCES